MIVGGAAMRARLTALIVTASALAGCTPGPPQDLSEAEQAEGMMFLSCTLFAEVYVDSGGLTRQEGIDKVEQAAGSAQGAAEGDPKWTNDAVSLTALVIAMRERDNAGMLVLLREVNETCAPLLEKYSDAS